MSSTSPRGKALDALDAYEGNLGHLVHDCLQYLGHNPKHGDYDVLYRLEVEWMGDLGYVNGHVDTTTFGRPGTGVPYFTVNNRHTVKPELEDPRTGILTAVAKSFTS